MSSEAVRLQRADGDLIHPGCVAAAALRSVAISLRTAQQTEKKDTAAQANGPRYLRQMISWMSYCIVVESRLPIHHCGLLFYLRQR